MRKEIDAVISRVCVVIRGLVYLNAFNTQLCAHGPSLIIINYKD